jgi:sugar phosphate isomerase/epimerase
MRLTHAEHPGRGLHLSYGLNVFPSRDADGVLAGLRAIALPLRARLGRDTRAFGVGAWLPGAAARVFARDRARFTELAQLCLEGGLDPASFNAFPQGDFHGPGLKERVFEPTWKEHARLEYTLDVARVAARLRAARGGSAPGQHLSLSTHAGMFAPHARPGDEEAVARGFVAAARALAELEHECGERVVLALEPEPRSLANDTAELERLHTRIRALAGGAEEHVWRHIGTCLDTCHAAIEFEASAQAFTRATANDVVLGKLQFSSALVANDPTTARAQLLALDEPVYLHQVTARDGARFRRALDLGELRGPGWDGWKEWRCHFHVPVDLEVFGGGLRTTRAEAAATLAATLANPERWGLAELHVEVETYTWNLLAPAHTGTADVLDGLTRELLHVQGLLHSAGWLPAVDT